MQPKRAVNLRFLAGSLGVALLLGGAVFGLHQYQAWRQAPLYLGRAQQAREANDLPRAADWLRRYVALRPNHDAVAGELGVLLADLRRLDQAYFTLSSVLRRTPQNQELRKRLVRVSLQLGRTQDARADLNKFLLRAAPSDPEVLELEAYCLEAEKKLPQAIAVWRRVIEADPQRLEAYVLLHQALTRESASAAADPTTLDLLIERNSDSARARQLRGATLMALLVASSPETASPLRERVQADARRAVELAPRDPEILMFAARAEMILGNAAAARDLAVRSIAINPRQSDAYLFLHQAALRARQLPEAESWLEKGLATVADKRLLLWHRCALRIDQGQLDGLEADLTKLRTLRHPAPPIQFLEARLLVQKLKWTEAAAKLNLVVHQLSQWPDLQRQTHYWLGVCHEQRGEPVLQLAAFQRALESDPNWASAHWGAGRAFRALDRFPESVQQFLLGVQSPDTPASVLTETARMVVVQTLQQNSEARDWSTAESLIARLEQTAPDSPEVTILRAEILVSQDQADAAVKLLQDARIRKDSLELALTEAALAERSQDWTNVERVLTETRTRFQDSVLLRLSEARLLVGRSGKEPLPALRKLETPSDQFAEPDRIMLQEGLAEQFLILGESQEATRLLREVLRRQPENARARLILMSLAFEAGEASALKELVIRAAGPYARYGKALEECLAATKTKDPRHFQAARRELQEAQKLRPSWAAVPALTGRICDAQQDVPGAIAGYTRAIELGHRHPGDWNRVIRLLVAEERFSEADRLVRVVEARKSAFSSQLAMIGSVIALQLNDTDRALNRAQEAAGTQDSFGADLLLAHVNFRAGKLEEAEKAIRRAIARDEGAPAGWINFVQFLVRSGQRERAEAVLEEATARIRPPVMWLARAQALEILGRTKDAAEAYAEAQRERPENLAVLHRMAEFHLQQGSREAAQAALTQLVRQAATAAPPNPEEAAWGRRGLAILHAGTGRVSDIARALELIGENLAADPDSIPDQSARARVLATSLDPRHRDEARTLLTALVDRELSLNVPLDEERFLLAQLEFENDNWPKASTQIEVLRRKYPANKAYLVWQVQAQLSRAALGEAEAGVRRLGREAPEDFASLQLETRWNLLSGRHSEARSAVKRFASRARGDATEDLLRECVALLEQCTTQVPAGESSAQEQTLYLEEAGQLARRLAEKHPASQWVLAEFRCRNGQVEEGVRFLEEHWQDLDAARISAMAGAISQSGRENAPAWSRAVKVLESALAREPASLPLQLQLAYLLSMVDRFPEAEALFTKVLEAHPDHVLALNNWSVILALHDPNRAKEALEFINRAMAIAGPAPALLDSRSIIQALRGDLALAAADARDATLRGRSAVHSFHRAYIAWKSGQRELAGELLANSMQGGLKVTALHPLEQRIHEELVMGTR